MRRKIVASAEVGKPKVLSETHTIQVSFHGFEELPHEKNDHTLSPDLLCHGYPWIIILHPGGYQTGAEDTDLGPYVSVYLSYKGEGHLRAYFTIRIGSVESSCKDKSFGGSSGGCVSWGCEKFRPRRDVLDPTKGFLVNGTLTVEVDIQVWTDAPPIFTPRKRLRLNMEESFESASEGDTCFTVGDKRFMVYKGFIARSAPVLSEMADSDLSGCDIPINDVEPAIFETLLRFVYTDEPPEEMDDPRAVLKVANRFGCSGLKLIAEAELVKAGIDAENAAELLMFADSHSCALLREAALEFCLARPHDIRKSEGWKQLEESRELLAELVGVSPPKFSDDEYDTMRVATLRAKLDEKDLEVDGTRETLIRRLKQADEK